MFGCASHSDQFCVGCRIIPTFSAIGAGRNDHAFVDDHRTYRNLAASLSFACFLQGKLHESLITFHGCTAFAVAAYFKKRNALNNKGRSKRTRKGSNLQPMVP